MQNPEPDLLAIENTLFYDDLQLAEFQAVLLSTLYQYDNPLEILQILRNSPAAKPFEQWIGQFNPAMLELGAGIVKNWARIDLNAGKEPI